MRVRYPHPVRPPLNADHAKALDGLVQRTVEAIRGTRIDQVVVPMREMRPFLPEDVREVWPQAISVVVEVMHALERARRSLAKATPFLAQLDIGAARRLLRSRPGLVVAGSGKRRRSIVRPIDDALGCQMDELESRARAAGADQ